MLKYFRGRWPDEKIPDGEPTWLHYEVNVPDDVVLRSVEVFDCGKRIRNSLSLEERDGYPCTSLFHSPCMKFIDDWSVEEFTAEAFETLWMQSEDKPSPR